MILLRKVTDFIFKPKIAYAHCDIPCGIYETNTAMMAAHTVMRMVEVIEALPKESPGTKDRNNFVRCVRVKEEHAQLCKEQLHILWSDFFTPEHLEKFPDLHDKIWKATKLCSSCKRGTNAKDAQDLMEAVKEIDQIFSQVKNEPKEALAGNISDAPDSPMKKLMA